ncbi:hypothetical protein J4558_06025 [Leptolyngbya sp. 15MV]|nr:hypothetical protein J4558_06025 [Leptolyngbya sp. 15MV]
MGAQHEYEVPTEQLSLSGPVSRPEATRLPIRGDLAHVALARRYLVAHYVVPQVRVLAEDATLRRTPRADADAVADWTAGSELEVLDCAGAWAWACQGPEGPSGYLPLAALEK